MFVQVSRVPERFLTNATFVRFLSTVNSAVYDEAARRRELFVADRTDERLHSEVSASVHSEVMIVLITLATLATPVPAGV